MEPLSDEDAKWKFAPRVAGTALQQHPISEDEQNRAEERAYYEGTDIVDDNPTPAFKLTCRTDALLITVSGGNISGTALM